MVYQWNTCNPGATYAFGVDWANNGDFADSGDDVTHDFLSDGATIEYGREQDRQLSPTAVGRAAFSLTNVSRTYSPENTSSPLYGNLEPARPVRISATFQSVTYPLFTGRIDDFDIQADRTQRTVNFSALDGLSLLQNTTLSTSVYAAMRTGDLVNVILDAVGWTGGRDIDPGATIVPWWWSESNAFDAVQELVRSEGTPAIAYAAPDGTFVFRDRHHRILKAASLTSQATFAAARVGCDAPAVTGFGYVDPFAYQHGWKDIVNSVTFSVDQRAPDAEPSTVWTSSETYTVEAGQSVTISVEASDPFINVSSLDATFNSGVTLSATINRTSGQSATLTLRASGGTAVVTSLSLLALSLPVRRTVKVTAEDSVSIAANGRKEYPYDAPWASVWDAQAVASIILAHYAQRRPTVKLSVVAADPSHLVQILSRAISDRITIRNDEMGLNDDFFIESVAHSIQRIDPAKGPIHKVVFGCERQLHAAHDNPFTFDKSGAGFDQGYFGVSGLDNAGTVFIFDHPTQGQFDTGLFGT